MDKDVDKEKCMISQWGSKVKLNIKEKTNNAHSPPLTSSFINRSKQLKGFKFPN